MTSIEFELENTHHHMKPLLLKEIAKLLNIPLFDLPDHTEQLLIGEDLIPSLLMPSPSLPTRHIALSSNLNVIETRLGYYIQEAQQTSSDETYYNWSHYTLTWDHVFWFFIFCCCLII